MPGVSQQTLDKVVFESKFDIAIEWFLIGLLTFMPLAFGVVHAWSEEITIILSSIIITCFLLKLVLCSNQHIVWSWAYIPLIIFLVLVIIQLIPLPAYLVRMVSPNTATLKSELLVDMPDTENISTKMTVSFYPYATKHDLRLIFSLIGVFFVVLNVFRKPKQIKRLLMGIAFIGGAIATLTLAQNLFGNGKIYWLIASVNTRGYSGPFVNHSHYGQFINLSIGAGFGLIIVKLHEVFKGNEITLPRVFEYSFSSSAILPWILIAIIIIGAATVFVSLSRGGTISMLAAACFITLLLSSKRRLRNQGWIVVFVALAAFTCVLYLGFDAVYYRLASFRNINSTGESRLQILRDLTEVYSKFPFLGTGLGTHSVVYPMFEHSNITDLASHAENEYAQVIEETGFVGLSLLITFGIIIGFHFSRNIRYDNNPIRPATYGLGFGITAILIHSLSDFGQHLPANSFLTTIFCALLISMSKYDKKTDLLTKHNLPLIRRFFRVALFLSVSTICIWSVQDAHKSRLAEAEWKQALIFEKNLIKSGWTATNTSYEDLINHAATASNLEPENVKYIYWHNMYRWREINQSGGNDISGTLISGNSLHETEDIVKQLLSARILCPTYGPIYTTVGQIEKFIFNNDEGGTKIRKGYLLAPCDPIACFMAGYLDVIEGKYEQCIPKIKKAVQLDESLYPDAINIFVEHLSDPYEAMSLAGENIDRLNHLARVLEENQYYDLVHECRERVKNILEKKCSGPNVEAADNVSLARIYKQLNKTETAVEYYKRALMMDYSKVNWRIELAKLLAETNRMNEAMREAKICLRIKPNSKEAEKLVADLSINPKVWGKETQTH